MRLSEWWSGGAGKRSRILRTPCSVKPPVRQPTALPRCSRPHPRSRPSHSLSSYITTRSSGWPASINNYLTKLLVMYCTYVTALPKYPQSICTILFYDDYTSCHPCGLCIDVINYPSTIVCSYVGKMIRTLAPRSFVFLEDAKTYFCLLPFQVSTRKYVVPS